METSVISWIGLAVVCVVAYFVGELLARVHVPRLPVYLAVGAVSGILLSSMNATAKLAFPGINTTALCVIGFVAGSHLVWQAVQPRLRPIASQVIGMTLAVPTLVGVFVFVFLPSQVPTAAKLAAALLTGSVMLALSPPEAIAVISEARSAGAFTKLVLGATVVMDVVVVSTFSVAITLSKALLGGSLSVSELAMSLGVGLALAVVAGLLVGWLLTVAFKRVGPLFTVMVIVFGLAVVAGVSAVYFREWAAHRLGLEVEIESLLVAMIAGIFAVNRLPEPDRFIETLEKLAPWVYVVFFTLTGLGLHLEELIAAIVPALVLWVLRLGGLWAGSTVAMTVAGEPPLVRRIAWRAFVPQAGIALALASTIAVEFPQAGPLLSSAIIGTVVLNEATGPFFLRSALHAAGEVVPEGEVLD